MVLKIVPGGPFDGQHRAVRDREFCLVLGCQTHKNQALWMKNII